MGLLQFLTDKTEAAHDATARSEVQKILEMIFQKDRWEIEIEVNIYTNENISNLWSNELPRPLKAGIEAGGGDRDSFKAWLGEVHYVNIRIAAKRIFEHTQSNQGWRISVISIPAAGVIAVGIASHYQGGMNHNALGRASAFLNDVAREDTPDGQVLIPGRKVAADDWDRSGLFVSPINKVAGVQIPATSNGGNLTLKGVRTTTVKKILASYIAIEPVDPAISEHAFLQLLRNWEAAGWMLATQVPPFTSVQDFEALRALAIQDLAAANLRLQLRRKSATRSIVRIYYGPPGTGKTLAAVRDAVKISDPSFDDTGNPSLSFARFNELTDQVSFITFHQALQYEDAIESIRPIVGIKDPKAADENDDDDEGSAAGVADRIGQNAIAYQLHEGVILRAIREALKNPSKEFVVVIDEINRGDISRIIGPLISALEPDKRLGAEYPIGVELQYPRAGHLETRLFLPANLHFLGTMNSADRNIALVDHALRRRFDFVAIPPEPNLLRPTKDDNSIDLRALLTTLNHRITHLLGAEYAIGHGYFMSCDSNEDTIRVMARKIIPLLEEYFFGNPGLMLLVLGEQIGAEFNMHVVAEPTVVFETLFNVPKDKASVLGYRPQEASLGTMLDPRFWDGNKPLPGPGDSDFAVKAIQKVYSPLKSPSTEP
jgi:5-methylcytosine-specific restriction protein B